MRRIRALLGGMPLRMSLLVTLVVLLARWGIPGVDSGPTALWLLPVAIGSWYGGMSWGLAMTAVCAALSALTDVMGVVAALQPPALWELLTYILSGVFLSVITGIRRETLHFSFGRLRQQEDRLKRILETSRESVLTVNDRGVITYASDSLAHTLDFERGSDLDGMPLELLIPPVLRGTHRRGFQRYLETGEPTVKWESMLVPVMRRDGHTIPMVMRLAASRVGERMIFTAFFKSSIISLNDRPYYMRKLDPEKQ